MRHLSLWFGKERVPGKRRAMVNLLEKLATTPGDETAGCAVMMLADMRQNVAAVYDRRAFSANKEAGRKSMEEASDGRRPPLQVDGLDWGRVDQVLETASRRLVGDAGAGADVRMCGCADVRMCGSVRSIPASTARTRVRCQTKYLVVLDCSLDLPIEEWFHGCMNLPDGPIEIDAVAIQAALKNLFDAFVSENRESFPEWDLKCYVSGTDALQHSGTTQTMGSYDVILMLLCQRTCCRDYPNEMAHELRLCCIASLRRQEVWFTCSLGGLVDYEGDDLMTFDLPEPSVPAALELGRKLLHRIPEWHQILQADTLDAGVRLEMMME